MVLYVYFLMILRPPRSTHVHTLSLHDALPIFRWQLRDDHMVTQLRMPQNFADQSGTLLDDIKAPSVWRDAAVLPVISGSFLGDVGVNATPLFRGTLMLSGQVIDAAASKFYKTLHIHSN